MSGQVNIFLLLFGGLQGLLLSLLLIKKRSYRIGYGFLIAYILVLIVQVLFKVISKAWLIDSFSNYYFISYKLPLLYGPLVLLFTRHILKQRKIQPFKEVLHFIPFIFAIGITLLADPYFLPDWIEFLFNGASGTAFQVVSLLVYHYFALAEWQQHYKRMKDHFSNTRLLRMQWLKHFIILSAFVCTAITLLLYYMYMYYPGLQLLRWGFIALSFFIYWISYTALHKPVLFSAIINEDWNEKTIPVVTIPNLVVHKKPEKYANTGLKDEEAIRILHRLAQLIQEQKLFLDPELNIDKLASLAGTNRHFLSQVLNERVRKSFYDYVNHYRVNEAKKLLLDEHYLNQKIASIAYDAGFNSLSAFNEVFKKITGTTPSQFRKNMQQGSRQQRG